MNHKKLKLKFEKEYFDNVYEGEYQRRNPDYKQKSFLKRILKYKQKGRLLDLGCAYGSFLKHARAYFRVEGIDISAHAISVAKKNLPDGIKLQALSLEKMDLATRFDVVTCFDVLEHLKDVDQSLKIIKKHLAPNGILAITMPVYDGPIGRLVDWADKDETHQQRRARSFWLVKLKQNGFKINLFEGIFRYFLFHRFYLNWLSKSIRNYSPAIFVIAKKKSRSS